MSIELGDWHSILTVLHETYSIWSAGLTKANYLEYTWLQMNHRWSRKNYRFLIYRRRGKVAASCKLYSSAMDARGKTYRVGVIGAVYTQQSFRNEGCASALMEDVINLAAAENYDGLLLYTEIGPAFYERFGFRETGGSDFNLVLTQSGSDKRSKTLSVSPRPIERTDAPEIIRHYKRWLRTQPYGVHRTPDYVDYKVSRERYLHQNSRLCWPCLEITCEPSGDGYMITETGGATIRVLEVVGCESGRAHLWELLLERAQNDGIQRLRGWESNVRDFAPGFRMDSILSEGGTALAYNNRNWGRGMLLPLNKSLKPWHQEFPCPLLELDHV